MQPQQAFLPFLAIETLTKVKKGLVVASQISYIADVRHASCAEASNKALLSYGGYTHEISRSSCLPGRASRHLSYIICKRAGILPAFFCSKISQRARKLDTLSENIVEADAVARVAHQEMGSSFYKMGTDLIEALTSIFPAMFNLAFIMVLIALGSYLGAYAKWSRAPGELTKMPLKSVLFGIAASFLCVPFFSSVIHIEYAAIMLPVESNKIPQFVQHALLLISISGIASYLGYAMLDGIADKVLRKEIEEESEERKKQDEQIFKQQKQLRARMLYLEAVTTAESAEKTGSENLLKDALKAIDEAVAIYGEDKSCKEYYQASVHKAFILKRLQRIQEALQIVNDQLAAGWSTPITLYNKACYLYLLMRGGEGNTDAIKELIRRAITMPTESENYIKKQDVLRTRVSTDEEPDLKGLFDEQERAVIATLGK